MKVVLDLDDLVTRGEITAAEAERLKSFAAADTGALGANILFALGALAVAVGIAAVLPSLETAMVLGAILLAVGLALRILRFNRLDIFAQIVLVVGALALCAGVGGLYGDVLPVRIGLTLGLAAAAVLARSGLLAGLAVAAFASIIVIQGGTWLPDHLLGLAILALAGLVLVLYLVSLRLAPEMERLAVIAMRVAIVLVNLAFFAGSVLGDAAASIAPVWFSVAWGLALLAFGAWSVAVNRRWVVNSVAVFGAIHFFTQWFLLLGPQPLSIAGGGLLLIAFGFALVRFNRWSARRGSARG